MRIPNTFRELGRLSGRAAAPAGAIGLALGIIAATGIVLATDRDDLAAVPVPDAFVSTVITAGASCPALTPARLAGQLMAASGFDPNATTDGGGHGIAGLTDDMWKQWVPNPTAKQTDPKANIVALAHFLCDLVGNMRGAKVPGDPWSLAVAAQFAGVEKVVAALGVPPEAAHRVDTVATYAAWYERQPQIGGGTPSPGHATAPPTGTTSSAAPSTPRPTAQPSIQPSPRPSPTSQPTATKTDTPVVNLALGRPIGANSHYDIYTEDKVNDGDAYSFWESAQYAFPQWIQVDLGTPTTVGRIVIKLPPVGVWGPRTQTLSVLGSTDGASFATLVGMKDYWFDSYATNMVTIAVTPSNTRYLRLDFAGNDTRPSGQVSELEVYRS